MADSEVIISLKGGEIEMIQGIEQPAIIQIDNTKVIEEMG